MSECRRSDDEKRRTQEKPTRAFRHMGTGADGFLLPAVSATPVPGM